MQPPRILAQTPEYQVQNFSPPVKVKGSRLREGGKFSPRLYSSKESFSGHLSPEEFRQTFEQPSEDEGSVVERMPISRYGTGHRRHYNKTDNEADKGIVSSTGRADVRNFRLLLYCLLGSTAAALGYIATCL